MQHSPLDIESDIPN